MTVYLTKVEGYNRELILHRGYRRDEIVLKSYWGSVSKKRAKDYFFRWLRDSNYPIGYYLMVYVSNGGNILSETEILYCNELQDIQCKKRELYTPDTYDTFYCPVGTRIKIVYDSCGHRIPKGTVVEIIRVKQGSRGKYLYYTNYNPCYLNACDFEPVEVKHG